MLQPEMRCIEFVEAVTDWMEGGLDDDERTTFEEHLAFCRNCAGYVAQIRLSTAAVSKARQAGRADRPSAETRAALLDAFRRHRSPA